MSNNKVSIIIPLYNGEKTIARCLNSLINQTYKNTEIIIINDGSTDNSLSICKSYLEKYINIILLSKENGGLSSARNYGIKNAKGELITFVDSDDYVALNYIEILILLQKKTNADICMSNIVYVDNYSNIINDDSPFKDEIFNSREIFNKLLTKNGHYYTMAQGKLFKKDIIINHLFKEGAIHEDDFFSNEVYSQEFVAVTSTKQLYYYVKNDNGITSKLDSTEKLFSVDALLERIEIMNKYYLPDTTIVKNSIYGRILHSVKYRHLNGLKKGEIYKRIKSFLSIKPHSMSFYVKSLKLIIALIFFC